MEKSPGGKVRLLIIALSFIPYSLFAQMEKICKAVENGKFRKVERIIARQIHKMKLGIPYDNGPGSGMQISHRGTYDTLVNRLNKLRCVDDAYWDRCMMKIAIYPGWSVIGARFKSDQKIFEKCFRVQEGTTGDLSIFGWRFHLFKAKNILRYQKMYDCNGFVEEQRKQCNDEK